MSESDEYDIKSRDALRDLLPENPATAAKISTELDDYTKAFIARCPFLVLSTADVDGRLDASPKGDDPGFVHVVDDHTIVIPDRPGNKLAMGHENIIANPHVGILFMIPGTGETLRVNGRATLSKDPELLARLDARGRPAVLALRVDIEECFFHCAKAFIRSKLWQPETWGERHPVSFGRMIAARIGADDDVVQKIDDAVEENYRNEL